MRVVLVDPDSDARVEVSAVLRRCGLEVVPFADPVVAFLFLLARVDEMDGVVVNDDDAASARRLIRRVEMLSARLPVVRYSARHPEREACVSPPCESDAPAGSAVGPASAWRVLEALMTSASAAARSARAVRSG